MSIMLRPLLVEYTEPGMPLSSHLQQQGNMALFLTLFIVTCVEVLIVKVAQIEVDLGIYLTPHDPPYLSEYSDDEDYDDEEYDICRAREAVYEEEFRRQKKILLDNANSEDFETRKPENAFGRPFNRNYDEDELQSFQSNVRNTISRNESHIEEKATEKEEPNSDTIQVREFIEKMVETLIGGPLDGTTVGQLSNHSAYKRTLELDSSNLSQCNLKRLIRRIISEAMTLPNIKEILCRPKTVKVTGSDDFKNKSYEDILATAILNKVIEHFQKKENETIDKPKPRPRTKIPNRNHDDEDQRSNSDWSDASRSDQLSLTIEEYVEEVTTALEASEDERSDLSDYETGINRRIPFPEAGRIVVDGTDHENSDADDQSSATELFTSTSSWEENWLFQKKRLRSTPNAHHPVPVPMLVPNPSEDYRALVGGVDADDLSDISDCSDLILEDSNLKKKPLFQLSTSQCDNGTEELLTENENRKDKEGVSNEAVEESQLEIGEKNLSVSPMTSGEERNTILTAASEDEMIEKVKLNSSPTSPSQKDREFSVEDFHLLEQCESSSWNGVTQTSMGSENGSVRSRVAEKEKAKWNNPVPLVDNPYSLESIEKRAQQKKNDFFRIGTYTGESIDFPDYFSSDELTKSSENLRFTRDYYINGSKSPSGTPLQRKGYEQKSSTDERNNRQETETFMMQEKNIETTKINKKEFCLPNVKELAKQFVSQDEKKTQQIGNELGNKSETKQTIGSGRQGREPELDYSTVPVSEIVFNLQQSKQAPVQGNKQVPYDTIRPKTHIEICRKTEADDERKTGIRYNGKQVHSLTARSISKEFREGLKNNSYQNVFLRINRAAVNGEREQRDVVHGEEQKSLTPSVDLKNMKKFWEELISANATVTKQK